MREFGVDDALGSRLVPLLGATLAAAMLSAIVYGLSSDARWAARHGTGRVESGGSNDRSRGADSAGPANAVADSASAHGASAVRATRSAWPTLLAVVLALAAGATITLATIAFTAQRYFESRQVVAGKASPVSARADGFALR